jgi:hypothetical protein
MFPSSLRSQTFSNFTDLSVGSEECVLNIDSPPDSDLSFARALTKRSAKEYERQLQATVKEAHRKSFQKVA